MTAIFLTGTEYLLASVPLNNDINNIDGIDYRKGIGVPLVKSKICPENEHHEGN